MKKALITACFTVTAVLLIMLFGFNVPKPAPKPMTAPVLLLTEDDTGAFLLQLRLGAQAAMNELDGELIPEVVHPDRLSADSLQKSYSGALVCIQTAELRQAVLRMLDETGLPSVVVGSSDGVHTAVCPDEAQLGQCAAELAKEAPNVCIYGGSPGARDAAARILGEASVCEDFFDFQCADNAVLALDFHAAQKACAAKSLYGWKCALYTVSPGGNPAAPLEQGIAQAMILQSPYAIGYCAAAQALRKAAPAVFTLPYFAVDRASMYDARNVKLIFPLLN